MRCKQSSTFHLVLPGLLLAERDVLLGSLLVETTSASGTTHVTVLLGLLHLLDHPRLLFRRLVVVPSLRLLHPHSQRHRLLLPLRDFLLFLHLLDFLVNCLPLLHQLHLLPSHYPVVLSVELLPFLLEHLSADSLMLLNTIRVEFSTASLPTHPELRGVIFHYIHPVFSIHLLYRLILVVIAPPPRYVVVVLISRFFVSRFGLLPDVTVTVSILKSRLLVLLRVFLLRRCFSRIVLFHLLIWISAFSGLLSGLLVIVVVFIFDVV